MKIFQRLILTSLWLFTAALVGLPGTSAMAQNERNQPSAETPKVIEQPLAIMVEIKSSSGKPYILLTFNKDLMAAESEKGLKATHWPIPIEASHSVKNISWLTKNSLALYSDLPADDFMIKLVKNPLNLIWTDKNTTPAVVTWKNKPDFFTYPYILEPLEEDENGRPQITFSLAPLQVRPTVTWSGSTLSLQFAFNHPITKIDPKLKQKPVLKLNDLPFEFAPLVSSTMTGYWSDGHTLAVSSSFTQSEVNSKITGHLYNFKWKDGPKSLTGVPLARLGEPNRIYSPNIKWGDQVCLKEFSATMRGQVGLDPINGWTFVELWFNKPVEMAAVKNTLKVEKVEETVKDGKIVGQKKTPLYFEIDNRDEQPWNQVAILKVKAGANDKLEVLFTKTKPADGIGLIDGPRLGVTVNSHFTITDNQVGMNERYPWKPFLDIRVQEELKPSQIAKFVKIDPPMDFTVMPTDSGFQVLADFNPEKEATVTLLKGMPSATGALIKNMPFQVSAPKGNEFRKLSFTGRGRYLSSGKPLLVKMAGRNVQNVRVQAWKIYENNLPLIINTQGYDEKIRSQLASQFSKNLFDRETKVDSLSGDLFERLLDMKPLLAEDPNGVYLLKISPVTTKSNNDEEDYYYDYRDHYYNSERYLPAVISDLGLASHTLGNQVTIWVNSLSAAASVPEAEVRLYDEANQILAQGQTDADGLCRLKVEGGKAIFATVKKDGDLTYMLLNDAAGGGQAHTQNYGGDYYYDDYYYDEYGDNWRKEADAKWFGGSQPLVKVPLPGNESKKPYLKRGYEAFVFMPRDLFKPGENVPVKVMIRDKNLLPPEKTFPVMWSIIDPDNRVIGEGQAVMNENGGLDFTTEIPFSARTGQYEARLSLPESSAPLGTAKFTVEDFVPPRLAIEAAPEASVYIAENSEIKITAQAKYLFGAPGADLNYEVDVVSAPEPFKPEGWAGFDFSGVGSAFETTTSRSLMNGRLNDQGLVNLTYTPELDPAKLPGQLMIGFVIRVQEDGGRWNAQKTSAAYFPRKTLIGVKDPTELEEGRPATFEVAALNPEGQPAEGTSAVKAQAFKVNQVYYRSYRDDRYRQNLSEELSPLKNETLSLKNGRAQFTFTPEKSGLYELRFSDAKSGTVTAKRVQIHGLQWDENSQAKGLVEINFDKPSYRPGDEATVKIKAPFPGRLLLTLEKDEFIYSRTLQMTEKETEVKIPVTDNIVNNAYLTATVVRPLAEGQTTHRAIGAASLEIDREINRLVIHADAPEKAAPSGKVKFKLKLTDQAGQPVAGEASIALVDEGILSLTRFKTPDPWQAFTASRRFETIFHDLYDHLLPLEKQTVPFLTPGGGDELSRAGLFSPFRRRQEMLSIFLATVTTDSNGEAEVELSLPEYSGAGRLMIVASSRSTFNSWAQEIKISRDLTAEATLPLALAPGDEFQFPVRVFMAQSAPEKAGEKTSINIKTEGPITIIKDSDGKFNLKPGQAETKAFKAVARPKPGDNAAGVAKVIISSRDGLGREASQTFEVVVRPPYPRVTTTTSGFVSKGNDKILIPADNYLEGTVESSLTIAKNPAIEAARAMLYLNGYPYGCLEQTTSKAWRFVAGDDLLELAEPGKIDGDYVNRGLKAAASRLATMQTTSGGFATWPGSSGVYDWGTIYATHFLTAAEAKISLPDGLKRDALKWVRNYLSTNVSNMETEDGGSRNASTMAYAVYVLALNGDYQAGWVNTLKSYKWYMEPSGLIFLAGAQAIHEGRPRALEELENEKINMLANNLSEPFSSLESTSRNRALKLMVWNEVAPLSETAQKLALAVVEDGRKSQWRNTQENGLAIFSLGTYLNKTSAGKPYTVTLNDAAGKEMVKYDEGEIVRLTAAYLKDYYNQPITMEIDGSGVPYYSLIVSGVPKTAPAPAAVKGLSLERTWILSDGSKYNLSTARDTAATLPVAKGDLITVEIMATSIVGIQNMVLVDLLPGGFEIENPNLEPKTKEEAEAAASDFSQGVYKTHLELREDRLVVIEPFISGTKVYRYTLRAVGTGTYTLPPTAAEGMYEPERQAILATGKVTVSE